MPGKGMDEPIAFFNGQYIPRSQLGISVVDSGFVLGVTIAEQIRTFRGQVFRAEDHLQRLWHSLEILSLQIDLTPSELLSIINHVVEHNHRLLDPEDDLGVSAFVTPGRYIGYSGPGPVIPTVCVHTYPLPFSLWASKYRSGQAAVTSRVRQVPISCWPRELKCRSRMHYFLAEKEAQQRRPGSRAILLDQDDLVTEAATANVVICDQAGRLLAPPLNRTLPGISLKVVNELAITLGIPFDFRPLTVADLELAKEILFTSTPYCILPVTELNGQPVGNGKPGALFTQLLSAWSDLVKVDIVAQAARFCDRKA